MESNKLKTAYFSHNLASTVEQKIISNTTNDKVCLNAADCMRASIVNSVLDSTEWTKKIIEKGKAAEKKIAKILILNVNISDLISKKTSWNFWDMFLIGL